MTQGDRAAEPCSRGSNSWDKKQREGCCLFPNNVDSSYQLFAEENRNQAPFLLSTQKKLSPDSPEKLSEESITIEKQTVAIYSTLYHSIEMVRINDWSDLLEDF